MKPDALEDAISRLADKPFWQRLMRGSNALVAGDGRIIAKVHETMGGGWVFGKTEYIDEQSAMRAAERANGVEPR